MPPPPVSVVFLGDTRQLASAFGQVRTLAKGTEGDLDKLSRKMSTAGKAMTRTLTVPLVAGAGLATAAFASFDDKLNQSVAIMGDVSDEMRTEMSDAAKEIAETTTFSAAQAAESYFFLASAGLDAKESVAALPTVARFAQAGMFDMATATDLATDAQSALGLTSEDTDENLEGLTRTTDVLVKANTLANASVQQFSEALTNKAGAALKVANKEMEEGVAVLAAYADRGVKGADAGEKLSIILRDIPRAVAKNSEQFERFGIEVVDADGNLRSMADIVATLEGALGGMSDAEQAAALDTLGLTRGVGDAIKQLLGASDQIRTYEEDLKQAGGITEEVADKQLESLTSQFKLARNEIVTAGIDLGETFAPAAGAAAGLVGDLASGIAGLPDPIRNTGIALGITVAAMGPALRIGGSLVSMYASMRNAIIGVNATAALMGKSVPGALLAMAGPQAAVAAGMAAVAGGALLAKRNVDQMRQAHDSATEAAEKITEALDAEGDAMEAVAESTRNLRGDLRDMSEEAARAKLFEIGFQLVDREGRSPDEAFAALERIAQEAFGADYRLTFDASDLTDVELRLEGLATTGARVAREVEANWLGVGTATKETLSGVAQEAARAFQLGEVDDAVSQLHAFQTAIEDSSLSTVQQQEVLNHLVDEFLKFTDEAGLSVDSASDLRGALEELSSEASTATAEQKALIEALLAAADAAGGDLAGALEAEQRAQQDAMSATDLAAAAHVQAEQAARDHAGGQDELGTETDQTTEAMRAQADAILALSDPFFGAMDAADQLEAANARLSETLADEEATAADVAAAQRDVAEAAFGLEHANRELIVATEGSDASLEDLNARLDAYVAQGLMTEDAAQAVKVALLDAGSGAEGMAAAVDAGATETLGILDRMIESSSVKARLVGEAIAAGMSEGIEQNVYVVRRAAGAAVADALMWAQKAAEIESPSRLFQREVGLPFMEGVAEGIRDGETSVEEALDRAVDEAVARAAEGVEAISSAFGAASGRRSAQEELQEARRELERLQQRRQDLPEDITSVRDELAAARSEAGEVTAGEEADILRARERLADAEERLQELRAGAGEAEVIQARQKLAAAEERLAEVREDSAASADDVRLAELDAAEAAERLEELREGAPAEQLRAAELAVAEARERVTDAEEEAVGPTEEVIELEERLAELRDERAGIDAAVEQARRDLTAAQLTAVEAEQQLHEAGQQLIAQGPAGEEMFRNLAAEAGVTRQEIDALVAAYQRLAAVSGQSTIPGAEQELQRRADKQAGRLRAAVEATGHDPGQRIDEADIREGLRRVGHDPGGRIDRGDLDVLIDRTQKTVNVNIQAKTIDVDSRKLSRMIRDAEFLEGVGARA